MTAKSLSKFTPPAAKFWAGIPVDRKKLLLSNVWCGKCRHEVAITNFSGVIRNGDLLLVGSCSICREDLASVVKPN